MIKINNELESEDELYNKVREMLYSPNECDFYLNKMNKSEQEKAKRMLKTKFRCLSDKNRKKLAMILKKLPKHIFKKRIMYEEAIISFLKGKRGVRCNTREILEGIKGKLSLEGNKWEMLQLGYYLRTLHREGKINKQKINIFTPRVYYYVRR